MLCYAKETNRFGSSVLQAAACSHALTHYAARNYPAPLGLKTTAAAAWGGGDSATFTDSQMQVPPHACLAFYACPTVSVPSPNCLGHDTNMSNTLSLHA